MKLFHTADWHWSEQKLDKCQKSAEFIIQQMEIQQPDVHVIAGDYWDRRQVLANSSAVLPAIEAMKRMAAVSPIIMVLGNFAHDAEGSLDVFRSLRTKYPIYVTEHPEVIVLRKDRENKVFFSPIDPADSNPNNLLDPETQFYLFPYPTKRFLLSSQSDISIEESNLQINEALKMIFMGFHAIGKEFKGSKVFVGHCNLAGAKISSGQTLIGQDILISKYDLSLVGAEYYALGHIHVNQEIAPHMWYSGSVYHTNYGETEAKYFNCVNITPKDVQVKRIEIPSRPLALHELKIDRETHELMDPSTARDWIDAELRVRIHLTKEQSTGVTDADVQNKYQGAWSYHIERLLIPEERLRSEEISTAVTLQEKMTEWACTINQDLPAEVYAIANEVEQRVHCQEAEGGTV